MRKLPKNGLLGAVTGAAIIAASGVTQAAPKEPNCHWNNNGYQDYKLAYPQSCKLKEYDSHTTPYTS